MQGVSCRTRVLPQVLRPKRVPHAFPADMDGDVTAQSVSGLISVLESDRPLNGRWYDYKGEEIPW